MKMAVHNQTYLNNICQILDILDIESWSGHLNTKISLLGGLVAEIIGLHTNRLLPQTDIWTSRAACSIRANLQQQKLVQTG